MIRLLPGYTYILMSPLIHTQCISGEIWQVLWVVAQLPHGIRRSKQATGNHHNHHKHLSLQPQCLRGGPNLWFQKFLPLPLPTASPRVVRPSSLCYLYGLYWGFWGAGEGGLVIWDAAMPSGSWGSWPWLGADEIAIGITTLYQFHTMGLLLYVVFHHHTFDFLSFTLYIFTQNMN